MMESHSGVITGVSVSHDQATVDEIAAAGATDQQTEVSALIARDDVSEAFALQTCNRAEAYVVTDDPATGRAAFEGFAPDVRDEAVVVMAHEESLRHLMRVAAGLESLVLGEDQILGQVRSAYEDARGAGGIGPMLEGGVTKAIHVGERARTETKLNEGVVSLGSAAAEVAERERTLAGTTVLVVGAGEMGRLAARAFDNRPIDRLLVVNRTLDRAEHVVETLSTAATARSLSALSAAVRAADVVVSTTASERPLIDSQTVADAGETVLVDLAQPRDVSPSAATLSSTTVHDLDTLETVTERTRRQRREAAEAVEAIIDREFERLLDQYKRNRADEVVATMYEGADAVKEAELQQALSQLEAAGDLTDEQRVVVESMADALVNKLLAAPTKSLRDAASEDDWTTIHTALQLFDPTFDGSADGLLAEPHGPREGSEESDPTEDVPTGALDDD
jgi:glutamyl-tRNA reductase